MTNPWLKIPASDYEGHMGNPNVSQLPFLADTFKEALNKYDSSFIALLGCATGNGLEYVNNQDTKLLTAIDINSEYLKILQDRYKENISGLEIVEADLEVYENENKTYSLIFAGLIFEYLNPKVLLSKIANLLKYEGVMVSVLQLPEQNTKKVSETSYSSLKVLNSVMLLITAQEFRKMAIECGLREIEGKKITLKTGKSFYLGTYKKLHN